jgi:DNA-directed RNA polymerase specialized sigma24 family protein
MPSDLTDPDDGPDRPPSDVAPAEVPWLGTVAGPMDHPVDDDPAAAVVAREPLRLALIASLQYLPARQRAILMLRDVLAFSGPKPWTSSAPLPRP